MNILVTGGAGYIGSHTVRALAAAEGLTPVVFDNLSTGHAESVPEGVTLVKGDIHDIDFVAKTLEAYKIDGVIHFAAYSLVGESMVDPAKDFPHNPTNVYGRTKLVIEHMMRDFTNAYGLSYVALRYFNAAGAALDGTIGEDHNPESHLIPLILKTAQGVRDHIAIYGTDYPTPDGTCIRDYIHVVDLADAHILAMQYLLRGGESTYFNLGSENGFSVRDIIDTAKEVTGIDFKVTEEARRSGDPAVLIASSRKCKAVLGWHPSHSDTREIIASAWKWHKSHPYGYKK